MKLEDTLNKFSKAEAFGRKFDAMPEGPLNLKQVETVVKLYNEVLLYLSQLSGIEFKDWNENNIDKEYNEAEEIAEEMIEFLRGVNDWFPVDALGVKRIYTKILGSDLAHDITSDWSIGKDSAKAEIKRLRKESPKLPKKKMKLKESIESKKQIEQELLGLSIKIRDKVPEAKNVKQHRPGTPSLMFTYKGVKFIIYNDKDRVEIDSPVMTDKAWQFIDELDDRLNVKDVKDVEKATKKIRSTAKKLPRKTMKLEDTLNEELTNKDLLKKLKKKVPNATQISTNKYGDGITFVYKKFPFILVDDGEGQSGLIPNLEGNDALPIQDRTSYFELMPELIQMLKAPTKEEAEEITKKIRKTATKLPKKTLKLEDALSEGTLKEKYKGIKFITLVNRYFKNEMDFDELIELIEIRGWKEHSKNANSSLSSMDALNVIIKKSEDKLDMFKKILTKVSNKAVHEQLLSSAINLLLLKDRIKFYKIYLKAGNRKIEYFEKSLTPRKFAKDKTKEIRKTSTVLPKKTMKLEDALREEWADSVQDVDGETYEIFRNPDAKDFSDLRKEGAEYIRFLIDLKSKTVYVWDGDLLHRHVAKSLKKPYDIEGTDGYVYGDGRIKKGKILFDGTSYNTVKDNKEVFEDKKYPWISKYFNNL